MKAKLLFAALALLLASCSSKKQIEKALHSGNYDLAIEDALRKLENNKDKARKQDFVIMLEDAYYKAVDRDLNTINHLKKDGNPENFKAIYERYLDMNARQEAIKPVLPLQIGGKVLNLKFRDYSNDIIASRNNLADYMYKKGLALLDSDNKFDIRESYEIFRYIERIYPNYEDTRSLMEEAYQLGRDFVIVTIENQTNQIIPQRLEDDLLNFDTYGLNQFWTVYHANFDNEIDYDYAMQLQLKRINISADELHEKQLLKEKRIVDGWKYLLDEDGNVAKDSLGNDIKVDNIINVKARYFEFNQFKSTQVIGNVVYIDLKHNQTLDAFAIDSQFIFENRYATVRGDKRALDRNELDLLNGRHIFFPSDAQMVYDTGEDLKSKLKHIIGSYRIRA
ncbi:hypothetical protein M0G43_11595 [Subsaxibacter sp. CAU 1640]|uniref:hypothetical protein n=1 Tax=Subsaxibacter sp. CAU 1640 TaxID=2933271 RepID=UPI0020059BD7|nr:hypothetical protein [Subsaxibacter sp. CAU 1640]MCK7591220.1 hypothetical protein [Subsaxibacter sp. CAU 1640]